MFRSAYLSWTSNIFNRVAWTFSLKRDFEEFRKFSGILFQILAPIIEKESFFWLTDYCKNSCTMADNTFITQGKAIPNQATCGWMTQQIKAGRNRFEHSKKAPFKMSSTILLNVDTVRAKLGKTRHGWQEPKIYRAL